MIRSLIPAIALLSLTSVPAAAATQGDPHAARVAKILAKTPLIDGHNDWPEALVDHAGDARWTTPLTSLDPKDYHTDITRLRAGHVGGQFWSVYVSANMPELDQVKATLEQIALVKQIVARYPGDFALATTAAQARAAHKAGRIASMMGV